MKANQWSDADVSAAVADASLELSFQDKNLNNRQQATEMFRLIAEVGETSARFFSFFFPFFFLFFLRCRK